MGNNIELREPLWNMFFENKEGVKALYLVQAISPIHDAYSILGEILKQDLGIVRSSELGYQPDEIFKRCKDGSNYLFMRIGTNYMIIDINNRKIVSDKDQAKAIDPEYYSFWFGRIIDKYNGSVDRLLSFYEANEELLNVPSSLSYRVNIGETRARLLIFLGKKGVQLGFYSNDKTLYDTIFFNGNLKLYTNDSKGRICGDELDKIIYSIGDIVIPYSVIPNELFSLGIISKLDTSSVLEKVRFTNK